MFNKNFYPTPAELIRKMIEPLNISCGSKILEPSAGKGDILDLVIEKMSYRSWQNEQIKEHFSSIEINKELQFILQKKGYKVVAEDFLTYNPDQIFDFIIMNPPFDSGVKHLLKAWEIAEGAEIICLLNEESIKNPYSAERKLLLEIIDQHGTVEFLANSFKNAERKTGVGIALVRLKSKAYKSKFKFNVDHESADNLNFEDIQHNDIARDNLYQNLEARYNKVKSLLIQKIQLDDKMQHFAEGLLNYGNIADINKKCEGKHGYHYYNAFMEILKKSAWDNVFTKTNISKYVTEKVRKDLQKQQDLQGVMIFTEENIRKLLADLYFNQENIMQECIENAFDLMTMYYKENRIHIEGWKTNDKWQVNRKVILPNIRDSSGLRWSPNQYSFSYQAKEKLTDIEKGLCFITGKNIQIIDSMTKVNNREQTEQREFGQWYESEFFEFKLFKKGTLHIKFKDEWIWKQFNLQACKAKNWLKGE